MKKIYIYVLISTFLVACNSSFLDYTPKGKLNGDQLVDPEYVDNLVTATYASLGNDFWQHTFTSEWVWGSVRSDDGYKGGGRVTDQSQYNQLEQFNLVTTEQSYINYAWIDCYNGVSRANEALRRMKDLSPSDYPEKLEREAECKFLRAHFYFQLKKLFKNIVWYDENTPEDEIKDISNIDYSNDELWGNIANDFEFAVENLPVDQPEVGRANKTAAWAYLAKVRLYQAYEQNRQNEVTNINNEKLQEVVRLCDLVISSGQHRLADDFAENFLFEYENGPESVFAIQYSVDDGTTNGRLDFGHSLNYNMSSAYGCCDFHKPSQNLVNAFRTDANGLPLLDSFNEVELKDSVDFWENTVDPRLDHTVGIPGHPFKYQPEMIHEKSWNRAPLVYGYFSIMKEIEPADSPGLKKVGAFFGSARNIDIIKYSDVLLWKAEALIELGQHKQAMPIINQIRNRAQNSTNRLVYSDGSPASNYKIELYEDGVNCNWTQDYARKALRFERRLEFATESPRFFDLVRWGIAAETLNNYFQIEKTRWIYLDEAFFTKGRDEYLPIPNNQIVLTEGLYQQNNGW
ncbi:RagB/SusD family nutrient uptake outer membrane protein [Sunxiuqinia sp. A32]|uniref:RagB/SusD family nutrient uptake outer membrane protein n=1 Tax=Sunxiuqinia sp. A32 TaxID=3461496 RepID=UPI004045FC03